MIIKQTTQIHVLSAIADRLIDSIEELNANNCWFGDQPIPATMPAGRFAVTVSMGDGNFPHEYFTGGGHDTTVDDGSVIITPLVVTPADRPRRAWKKVAGIPANDGDAPSLLYFKHEILKSLVGDHDWEPTHEGAAILRDMIAPLSYTGPRDVRVGETVATAMQMRFSTAFDWDLS